jgi:hypothetical protein
VLLSSSCIVVVFFGVIASLLALLQLFWHCYNSSRAIASLFMLLLVFLCYCNSFHTLFLHTLPCVLLLRVLFFSHIVLLARCYFAHCSFHALFFSHHSFHTQLQIPTNPSSCHCFHIDAFVLLTLLCSCLFHWYGTYPPLLAMCKLEIKGWNSHTKR